MYHTSTLNSISIGRHSSNNGMLRAEPNNYVEIEFAQQHIVSPKSRPQLSNRVDEHNSSDGMLSADPNNYVQIEFARPNAISPTQLLSGWKQNEPINNGFTDISLTDNTTTVTIEHLNDNLRKYKIVITVLGSMFVLVLVGALILASFAASQSNTTAKTVSLLESELETVSNELQNYSLQVKEELNTIEILLKLDEVKDESHLNLIQTLAYRMGNFSQQVNPAVITSIIHESMARQPIVGFMRLAMKNNLHLQLFATDHSTLLTTNSVRLAEINMRNGAQPQMSSNNLLAYRPRYNDLHNSSLAAIFINLEGVFPCLVSLTDYFPICSIFSNEEDGFRGGNALIDSGDIGNHFQIFSSTTNILTYGIAIQNCPELNESCFPIYHSLSVACYLPRAACFG